MFGWKKKEPKKLSHEEIAELERQEAARLKEEFEKQTMQVATRYAVDVERVRDAYEDKPESLRILFNSMSDAKSDRNSYIGWTVFWAVVFPPVALYTGYLAFDNNQRLSRVGDQVELEIERNLLEDKRHKPKALPKPPKFT